MFTPQNTFKQCSFLACGAREEECGGESFPNKACEAEKMVS